MMRQDDLNKANEANDMKREIFYTEKEVVMHVTGPKGVLDISVLNSFLTREEAYISQPKSESCKCIDGKCVALPPCPCPYSLLSVEQAKSFLKNGFLISKDLVPFERLNRARRYVDQHAEDFMNQSVRQDDWRLHLQLYFNDLELANDEQKHEYSSNTSNIHSVSTPYASTPDLRLSEHAPVLDIALSPRILSLAYALTGSRLDSCFYNQLGLRTPLLPDQCTSSKVLNYPKGAGFHLDGQANSHGTRFPDPWSLIVGVALRPLSLPTHGNFTVWKGTHLKYKWHKYPGLKRTRLLPDLGEASHICLNQGDAVFGHVLLPHRGGKNTMKGVKRRLKSLKSLLNYCLDILRDEIPTYLSILSGQNNLSKEEIDNEIYSLLSQYQEKLIKKISLLKEGSLNDSDNGDDYEIFIKKMFHFVFIKEKNKENIHESKIVRDEYYEVEESLKIEEDCHLYYCENLLSMLNSNDNEFLLDNLEENEDEINPFTILDDASDDFNEGKWTEIDNYEYDFKLMKKFLDQDMKNQIQKYENEQNDSFLINFKHFIRDEKKENDLSEKEKLYKKLFFKPINISNWTREVVFFRFRCLEIDYECDSRSPSVLDNPFHEHEALFDYIKRNTSTSEFESFCLKLQKEKHQIDLTV